MQLILVELFLFAIHCCALDIFIPRLFVLYIYVCVCVCMCYYLYIIADFKTTWLLSHKVNTQ